MLCQAVPGAARGEAVTSSVGSHRDGQPHMIGTADLAAGSRESRKGGSELSPGLLGLLPLTDEAPPQLQSQQQQQPKGAVDAIIRVDTSAPDDPNAGETLAGEAVAGLVEGRDADGEERWRVYKRYLLFG